VRGACSKLISSVAATEMWDLCCASHKRPAQCYTPPSAQQPLFENIFGPVEIVRVAAPGIYPLDQTLALPDRSFSCELQRRLVKAAVQNPFHKSVEAIADLTGVSVPKRSLEEILRDAAQDVDAFYQERCPRTGGGLTPG
jgi:hypothetical protein